MAWRAPTLSGRLVRNLYKFWYNTVMASPEVIQVHPLSEVRARLSGILARFRREGAAAEPVAFGSHRKPEAILIPYEAYERYEALARQRARLDVALSAAQSVQVELPGAFSPEHDREVSAYVDGEISAAELYRRTVLRYRRPRGPVCRPGDGSAAHRSARVRAGPRARSSSSSPAMPASSSTGST